MRMFATITVAGAIAGLGYGAAAQDAVQTARAQAEAARTNPYCANVADAAADARFAWQMQTLSSLEKDIEQRIVQLEKKRAEYEEWLRRRNEFLKQADEGLVAIFSRMRPDAAAQQLASLKDEKAAAIIARLNPRISSAILNEMEPGRAAQLTGTLIDSAPRERAAEKS
ncbi:Flagellar motility protein MotE, a chaperone for MotC folding [Chelatococcus sambhunathii]|uniref:Flagellar motility protein MotE, a chaperone for MotC folding n=1 Tax=Chelatococcus sambhunathii TaxID=363953 RepID=A0ABM9U123_9HYPH|nr:MULTISPECIES: MotE family protein [Chelatococcus]CUA85148.1 Flagellar motility protein MotE, a chaperone for MotC folding [Chelatococcus sambhunathii]